MAFLKNVGNSLHKKMLEIKSRHLTWGGPISFTCSEWNKLKILTLIFWQKMKAAYSFLPMGLLLKRGQNDISEIQNQHFLGHFGANCKRSRDFNLLNTQHHSVKFFDDI